MFTTQISVHTQELMGVLAPVLPINTYLAGGTALALHLDHRQSFDLDLYSPQEFEVNMLLQRLEKNISDFQLISTSWQTIHGFSQDTELSLFYYQYPLLEKLTEFKGLPISSVADIGAMKLEAILGRGLKRDFFDLYTICQQEDYDLEKLVRLNQQKYSRDESYLPHLLKSLTYFTDAEELPERAKIVDSEWRKVKEYFEQEVRGLVESYL